MNLADALQSAHNDFKLAMEGLTEQDAENVFITSKWSAKDIVAHMAAYETVMAEMLSRLISKPLESDHLAEFLNMPREEFNLFVHEQAKYQDFKNIWTDYLTTHDQVIALLTRTSLNDLTDRPAVNHLDKEWTFAQFAQEFIINHKLHHAEQIQARKKELFANRLHHKRKH